MGITLAHTLYEIKFTFTKNLNKKIIWKFKGGAVVHFVIIRRVKLTAYL